MRTPLRYLLYFVSHVMLLPQFGFVGTIAVISAESEQGASQSRSVNQTPTIEPSDQIKVRLSWGHQSPAKTRFTFQFLTNDLALAGLTAVELEPEDFLQQQALQTSAGGGDVDALDFWIRFPRKEVAPLSKVQGIWAYFFRHSDPETVRRLQLDPGYRRDSRKLTFQMNAEGTRGFSLTVDQLLTNRVFWLPELDVFVAVGDQPIHFSEHQKQIEPSRGRRVLEQVRREPEASYEDFTARWEDMGSPAYRNRASVPPGHIVCLGWDSSLFKFGIDRGAGVQNDYGKLHQFRFWFDFGDLAQDLTGTWKGQRLTEGLPVITTIFEKAGVRYEIEQFAYPLHGPPQSRRGDIPMVLMQKVKVAELTGAPQSVDLGLWHRRELPPPTNGNVVVLRQNHQLVWEESNRLLLAMEGASIQLRSNLVQGSRTKTNRIQITLDLPARGTREFVVKLPSPLVYESDRDTFLALDYAVARGATLKFWSDYLAQGAQFSAPEGAVNTLFRANLWHALRLPRRHGGSEPKVRIDLPYSNFAYDQNGTPWPVNEAVYVDYMLYDLRGHHSISAEELAVMFRNNQEPNGHIKGYANWGVYTPSMLYVVAQHFLLSGDRSSFENLLPQTLKALDWCLAEIQRASQNSGPTRGLILAPLNDLSHDPKAWAFNQAYFYGGVELLGRALSEIQHPRAEECRAAASAMYRAVQRGFGHASMQSPAAQLRDQTWIPYVPGDALTPRRLIDIWYPTDVDTGALHMSRLRALDPHGLLTSSLLHDHEDNLFLYGWSMANEPVYNQHATALLMRDDVKPVLRAFYSLMACGFSHSVFEPVEHRWGWGQYFGPPSTDGAWFDLYRHMLIHEREDGTLLLLQATPRKWLEDGKQIRVERAPTFYGKLSMTLQSRAAEGQILADIQWPDRKRPSALLIRFRHPQGKTIRSVLVNGQDWTDFDVQEEWVRIPNPSLNRYAVTARY